MNTDGNKQCQCAYSLQIYSRRWSYWKAKNHTSSWWNKKTWGQWILLTLRLLVVSTLFWFVIGSIYLPDWRSNSMPHYFFFIFHLGFFSYCCFSLDNRHLCIPRKCNRCGRTTSKAQWHASAYYRFLITWKTNPSFLLNRWTSISYTLHATVRQIRAKTYTVFVLYSNN